MIPQVEIDLTTASINEMPSKTFLIDFESGRIRGMADGAEAIKQAVVMLLSTERYRYLIHSRRYGVELDALIGAPTELALSQAQARISEALATDDRIASVSDFEFYFDETDRKWIVSCTVETKYGRFKAEKEVLV